MKKSLIVISVVLMACLLAFSACTPASDGSSATTAVTATAAKTTPAPTVEVSQPVATPLVKPIPASERSGVADHTWYEPDWPIVPEGEKVVVSVTTRMDDTYNKDPEDKWFWKWSQAVTGIDFEVEQIPASSYDERKPLMFASGNLPDLLLGLPLTTTDIVTYGNMEKQLLPLEDYINQDLMPYLTQWIERYNEIKVYSTSSDGHIYSLPGIFIYYYTAGNGESLAINQTWLDEIGLDNPQTVDELNEVLYAFKENYPDCTPLGGCDGLSPFSWIYNAFGYLTTAANDYGNSVAIREGKAVIPVADPVFKECLALLNQYYTDGIISQDFFTLDPTTVKAMTAEWKTGVYPSFPYTAVNDLWNKEYFQQWMTVYPLTSAYNDTQQWLSANPIKTGYVQLSSQTAEAENILRFLDFFYSDMGDCINFGPLVGSADTLGLVSGMNLAWNDTTKAFSLHYPDPQDYGKYDGKNSSYMNQEMPYGFGGGQFGNVSHSLEFENLDYTYPIWQYLLGTPVDEVIPFTRNADYGDHYQRICCEQTLEPYTVAGYPDIVYYSLSESNAITQLTALIDPFVESEVAKFITGARPISEFDQFVAELEAYGIRDLESIYQRKYDEFLAMQ